MEKVKRSARIKLLLLGGLAVGAAPGCAPGEAAVSQGLPPVQKLYPNNYYVAGLGYYHAPFREWYAEPYNAQVRGKYFYGGQLEAVAHRSIVHLSELSPSAQAALDRVNRVSRGGFGSSSHGRSYFS